MLVTDSATTVLRRFAPMIYGPTLLFAVGEGAVIPLLPVLAAQLGADIATAALVASALVVGQLCGNLPAGWAVARIGERLTMAIAGVVCLAGVAGMIFAAHIGVLAASVFVIGFCAAAFGLARHSFMTTRVPFSFRARALSLLGGTFRLGHVHRSVRRGRAARRSSATSTPPSGSSGCASIATVAARAARAGPREGHERGGCRGSSLRRRHGRAGHGIDPDVRPRSRPETRSRGLPHDVGVPPPPLATRPRRRVAVGRPLRAPARAPAVGRCRSASTRRRSRSSSASRAPSTSPSSTRAAR